MKSLHNYLFLLKLFTVRSYQTFINTGDEKPCTLGRPKDTNTFFPHEEYIIMDFAVKLPQMQLNELANRIFNATGSTTSTQFYFISTEFVQSIY